MAMAFVAQEECPVAAVHDSNILHMRIPAVLAQDAMNLDGPGYKFFCQLFMVQHAFLRDSVVDIISPPPSFPTLRFSS